MMATSSAGHSAHALLHRHAPLGGRQALRPHDPGRLLPRPLGVLLHRNVIFLVTAAMLLPYLIISITGGGTILSLADGQSDPLCRSAARSSR